MSAAKSSLNTIILRCKEVVSRLKLSRSTVYDKLDPNSPRYDPRFPKPIRLGPKAVGWLEHELETYLRECQRARH
ncbi:AlpA family phage regulatory protein [Chromobacterium violaceum]|uniref:helix-turn-helix transcriptional regulator n=1 Tax=Chromobacterium violaceum TaxID=536 RepID=UPI001BE524F5|nr:AlpA family phage regulatory protein [Chromobacterium violaceum]MBT2866320.1 AlpA family phage regulatory protein [Chromobacterium violaceum]